MSPPAVPLRQWGKRRLDPDARFGLRMTLFTAGLVLVAVPFGLLLQQVLSQGPVTRADRALAESLNRRVQGDLAAGLLGWVSFLGKPVFLAVVVAVAGVIVLQAGRRRLVVYLLVTAIGGGVVDTVVKVAVGRDRPELPAALAQAAGKSFPSGHAMSSLVVYGAVTLVLLPLAGAGVRRLVKVAVPVLLVAIGASRLALGVHFLSDVVAGWALGAAWLLGCTAVFETWRVERGLRRTDALEEGVEPELGA